MEIRNFQDTHWPQVFNLANQSIAHVAGAPTQENWLNNRQNFDETVGIRRHFVALNEDEDIIGYMAVESAEANEVFRLYIVTLNDLLPTLGESLYELAATILKELEAQQVWFTEYADNDVLLDFTRSRGFQDRRRFAGSEGLDILSTYRDAPF